MGKSYYKYRVGLRRLFSLRGLLSTGGIGIGALWGKALRIVEIASSLDYLVRNLQEFPRIWPMIEFVIKYGGIPILIASIWWLARIVYLPRKKMPYDLYGWDALQFIKNDTVFGRGQTIGYITKYIRWAATKGLITVWAKPMDKDYYEELPHTSFSDYTFVFEPEGCGGKVIREKGSLFASYYSTPRFSFNQLNAVFKSKSLLERLVEWLYKRQLNKAKRIEGNLRD